MRFQCLAQMRGVEVCIYLGCEYILVAEQLLHLTDVRTAFEQMCSKRVAECVGADALCDADTLGRLLDNGENHHAGKFRASVVEE